MWKYIVVIDRNFSLTTDHFTSILFEPADVTAWAKAVGNMSPNNHVQLERDYFSMNKVDKSWEVGHVGVSDLLHQYCPIVYKIAKGELSLS